MRSRGQEMSMKEITQLGTVHLVMKEKTKKTWKETTRRRNEMKRMRIK